MFGSSGGLPKTDKYSMMLENDKMVVGASSMQGWRSTMEDAHTVFLTLPRLKAPLKEDDGAIVAVFDGHCGSKCAHLCSYNIVHWLTLSPAYIAGDFSTALTDAFVKGDESLVAALGSDESGCTGVVCMIIGKTLHCASVGDSRAILCRGGTAKPLTEDHKPTLPEERKRIEKAGSFVTNGRINGVLALSRAFGDFPMKEMGLPPQLRSVSIIPDVTSIELTPEDEFLIVACDGLFELKSSEELVQSVRRLLQDCQGDVALACELVMHECLGPNGQSKGSDNMSIIVVQLKDATAGNGFTNAEVTTDTAAVHTPIVPAHAQSVPTGDDLET